MYPIEREDYINAYIGAISEEIRQSRVRSHTARDTEGSIDRLYRTVARMLNVRRRGDHRPARPLPAS
ncbi:MAG: hypothetical protein ABFS21_04690 [Actinomycetota bacterium]